MTEKWDKQALIDYFPVLLSEIEGNCVYVDVYRSRMNKSIDIEITEVKE